MFVIEAARGLDIGRLLLVALEDAARALGYRRVVLDTGRRQGVAHVLCQSAGYRRIPGFSIYRDRPGNMAFGKEL